MAERRMLTADDPGAEWRTTSWNPMTGCDRVSPGCDNCYALMFAARLKAMGQPRYQKDGNPTTSGPGFGLTLQPDVLDLPRTWRKPRHVFVGSMSDLFHGRVPTAYIRRIVTVMRETPRHTYQVLTKRTSRLARLSPELDWPANVWVGTSIEGGAQLGRAEELKRVTAAVRFLSLEPLLGPLPDLDLDGIDWVTVAGEAGPGARAMHPDWVRAIRDRAQAAGVPFLFLQWGGTGAGSRGRLLDGRTWNDRPSDGRILDAMPSPDLGRP